jgi:hypothetical protein
MKKGLVILIFLGLTLPFLTSAQHLVVIPNPIHSHTFDQLIGNIITFIWWIALALIPLMIVIAGFYFVTAAGDPAKVEKAKGIILYTVIGFIIILLARGLVELLRTLL